MTKHKNPKADYALPPLETILAATRESSQAMEELVSFYRPIFGHWRQASFTTHPAVPTRLWTSSCAVSSKLS